MGQRRLRAERRSKMRLGRRGLGGRIFAQRGRVARSSGDQLRASLKVDCEERKEKGV